MKTDLRLAIAQINCTVGDIDGNLKKITEYIKNASALGVDILSFPELAITGYPPEDLLLKNNFIDDNLAALHKVAAAVNGMAVVIGFADKKGDDLYNAAAVIYKGRVSGTYRKCHLPNYGVFDEKRYFKPGNDPVIFDIGGLIFAVNICEDIWHRDGPAAKQAAQGASLIININSSPYHAGRIKEREDIVRAQAKDNGVFISYANLVGGQDELIFDGQSMIVDPSGKIIKRAEPFKEDLLLCDLSIPRKTGSILKAITVSDRIAQKTRPPLPARKEAQPLRAEAEVYQALILGLKDYVSKNGFKKTVIGLSGGIDSSLVAALACDALGSENAIGVYMPTRYSSELSESDAKNLATNLGMKFLTIPIEQIFKLYLLALEPKFSGQGRDTAEENLQARIRGNMIMALSNKFGWMVLTTGNKSEMSTGYATLYGDMAGGLAVIKDVPKTLVYRLARYRNSIGKVIPDMVLTKEPTAELRPNQKDTDSLPPYNILDPILKAYIEEDIGLNEIVAMGFDNNTVAKVLDLVDNSEYKRRQSPPGLKITPKAFGRDRRMPITNKYK